MEKDERNGLYRIRWRGFTQLTWEPIDQITTDCPQLVLDFEHGDLRETNERMNEEIRFLKMSLNEVNRVGLDSEDLVSSTTEGFDSVEDNNIPGSNDLDFEIGAESAEPASVSNNKIIRVDKYYHQIVEFSCGLCEKKLTREDNLKAHMSIHEENRLKHECLYCHKAFPRKSNLARHMETAKKCAAKRAYMNK